MPTHQVESGARRESWLTVHELATEYRFHPSTITRILDRGDVEAYRVGLRQWRVSRLSWETYLAARRAGA